MELRRQEEVRKAMAQNLKEDLERKRELLRSFLTRNKQREKFQIKLINQELMAQNKQRDYEFMMEKKRQIGNIKERERILPFKIQYLTLKKREKIKELLCKRAEEEESVINEKKKELEELDKIEMQISRQLNRPKRCCRIGAVQYQTANHSVTPCGRNIKSDKQDELKPCLSYIV